MDALDKYIHAAKDAVQAAANGLDAPRELEMLLPLESELRQQIALLAKRPDYLKGAAAHSQSTREQRAQQRFILTYSGGGSEEVIGWDTLAKRIRLALSSIRVMLSQGKGRFNIQRSNPLTGERDLLIVARVDATGAIAKAKMGRPRTRPLTEDEYNAARGVGINLALPAKAVPKRTNRRTREKP